MYIIFVKIDNIIDIYNMHDIIEENRGYIYLHAHIV